MRPTTRQRLTALGTLLLYLASLPVLALLWVHVAYQRFPQLGFRDQLYQVGSLSTSILAWMLVVAVLVVVATVIGMILAPWAARIPLIGIAVNVAVWAASVAAMAEPPPIVGG